MSFFDKTDLPYYIVIFIVKHVSIFLWIISKLGFSIDTKTRLRIISQII